jgi:hypothetical protein
MPGRFAKCHYGNVSSPHTISKVGIVFEAYHCVAETVGWDPVNEIHEPIFEPAHIEPINHVSNQRYRASILLWHADYATPE